MKVLILDAIANKGLHNTIVHKVREKDSDTLIQSFTLNELTIPMCIGCGSCTERTHGLCVFDGDIHKVMKEWPSSDLVIQIDKITFGGFSSTMKRLIDHLMLIKRYPYIVYQGELHHENRYPKTQSLWVLGIATSKNPKQAKTFEQLIQRQQLSLKSPIAVCTIFDASNMDVQRIDSSLNEAFERLRSRGPIRRRRGL